MCAERGLVSHPRSLCSLFCAMSSQKTESALLASLEQEVSFFCKVRCPRIPEFVFFFSFLCIVNTCTNTPKISCSARANTECNGRQTWVWVSAQEFTCCRTGTSGPASVSTCVQWGSSAPFPSWSTSFPLVYVPLILFIYNRSDLLPVFLWRFNEVINVKGIYKV